MWVVSPRKNPQFPGIRRWPKEYLPKIFEPERVDRVMDVSQQEATEMARKLAKVEGVFAGMSSGGAALQQSGWQQNSVQA